MSSEFSWKIAHQCCIRFCSKAIGPNCANHPHFCAQSCARNRLVGTLATECDFTVTRGNRLAGFRPRIKIDRNIHIDTANDHDGFQSSTPQINDLIT